MELHTLNRFATVSSGAGENARLIYVNYMRRGSKKLASTADREAKIGRWTHQRVALFPTKLLPQELDDGLEPVRRGDLVEILLHDRGIAHRLETDDNCRTARQGATRGWRRRGAYGRDRWVDEHALVRNRTRKRLRRTFVGILLLVGVKGILSLLHDVPSAERGPC